MSYRALWTADLHISNSLPWAQVIPTSSEGMTDRLVDTLNVLIEMHEYARTKAIQDIWIAGDLFDKPRLDSVTLNAAMGVFLAAIKEGFRFLLIPGNHETDSKTASSYIIEALGRLEGFTVFSQGDTDKALAFSGIPIFPLPYKPAEVTAEKLKRLAAHVHAKDLILVMHQMFSGAMLGNGYESPVGISPALIKPFRKVFAGDCHRMQTIPWGLQHVTKGKGMYLGAPLKHKFGGDEKAQCGFWDITITDDSIDYQFVPTVAPNFHHLQFDADKDTWMSRVHTAQGIWPGIVANDYVRVDVIGAPSAVDPVPKKVREECNRIDEMVSARLLQTRTIIRMPTKSRMKVKTGKDGQFSFLDMITDYVNADEQKDQATKKQLIELGIEAFQHGGRKE